MPEPSRPNKKQPLIIPPVQIALKAALYDAYRQTGHSEAVACPLPVVVMAEMLGVPTQDRVQFKVWSAQRARLLEPTISRRERQAGEAALQGFDAYFRPIIAERRAVPRDDIVSTLVRAQDDGAHMSERETLNMLRLLLAAGSETTANLIGNGLLARGLHALPVRCLRG